MNRSIQLLIPLLTLMAFAVLVSACRPAADEQIPEDFMIILERGPCFGTCPVYTIAVSGDGTVAYEGLMFVDVEGEQTITLPEEDLAELFNAIDSGGFFNLEDSYTVGATDLATIATTVTMDGRTKTISHYGLGCGMDLDNAPPELCNIEALLEDIAVANGWVAIN